MNVDRNAFACAGAGDGLPDHGPWSLIAENSSACTLEPGDVIATRTGAGVAAFHTPPTGLVAGNLDRTEFDGIGAIENRVLASRGRRRSD